MFVDSAVVTFIAGKGGDGCISFRREKFIPKGGPDGGSGGAGGSIVLVSSNRCQSLVDLRDRRHIRAEKGVNGGGSNKTGKSGKDEIVYVPPGTIVKTYPEEKLLFDFSAENLSFTIAEGGKGGMGNSHFKSSVRQSPRFAQQGKAGESIKVVLELKLIAFAGLVGFPNAGKSTLISRISGARPKVADYPFTTLTPNLGMVYQDYEALVVADIPGIIENAHKGEGMGLDFLKHIERTRVLIFLLDASPYAEKPPLEALEILRRELESHKPGLLRKKSLVAANKIDLVSPELDGDDAEEDVESVGAVGELERYCAEHDLPYIEISALKEINLNRFKNKLFGLYHDRDT